MKESIFELTDQYLNLSNALEFTYDDQAVKEAFDSITGKIEEKADAYAYMVNEYSGKIERIEQEVARLNDLKAVYNMAKQRLKDNLKESMMITGLNRIKTDLHSFSICKAGGKQSIRLSVPEDKLPEEYRVYYFKPDYEKLRKAIVEDGDVTYADLEPRKDIIRIK